MSLFPAFSESKEKNEVKNENKESNSDWLQNTSFIPALPAPVSTSQILVPSSSIEVPENSTASNKTAVAISSVPHESRSSRHHKHKSKSKKHKKDKRTTLELMQNDYGGKRCRLEENEEEIFFVDKKKEPSFYGMLKLTGPEVPRYSRGPHRRPLGRTGRGGMRDAKARGRSRYYNNKKQETIEEESERPFWNHDTQAELKTKTEQLNRRVSQEPTDIDAWLELSRLQPSLLALSPRVGPALLSTSEKRAVVDKQIAILDKALASNPEAPQLITERYGLASTVVPADLLSSELRNILSLHPLLMRGWLELARVECSHLASCSVPKVTQVYAEALKAVSRRRRREPINIVESTILGLMLACGQFLQEAGLMEQVWTLVRLYTEASLPPDTDPSFISELQTAVNQKAAAWEDQSAIEEDDLLASGLPSSELWLRVEKLRSSAHFLPAPDCSWAREGDPQRLVFPEDLADLAQPVTTLALRTAVTSLLVLGAPPVPASHVATRIMSQGVPITGHGLLAANWTLLSPDLLIPCGWLGDSSVAMFSSHPVLMSGPGGLLYRQLLALVFTRLAGRLGGDKGRGLLAWWFRIETLLARIAPEHKQATAQARSMAKKLLKRPEHRGHPSLFKEFALFEAVSSRDLGSAEKILIPAVQAAKAAGSILCQNNRGSQISVFKSLAEIWSSQGHRSKVTTLLVSLVDENCDPISSSTPAPTVIAKALAKFNNVTSELLAAQNTEDEIDLIDILSDDFLSGWVSCHAWLLCSCESVYSAGAMLENVLSSLPASPSSPTLGTLRREILFSTYVSVLDLQGRTRPGGATLLRKVLNRALSEFPDNSSLLVLQANLSIPLGQDTKLYQSQQLLGNIIRVISLERRVELQVIAESSTTEIKRSPRIVSFYEKLISGFDSRHCPLVWKLYLRYVGLRSAPELIKSVFYKGLEDCPWVKDLYVQGARLLPEELSNIQDLIVEKELRLHVAPEELEILKT